MNENWQYILTIYFKDSIYKMRVFAMTEEGCYDWMSKHIIYIQDFRSWIIRDLDGKAMRRKLKYLEKLINK